MLDAGMPMRKAVCNGELLSMSAGGEVTIRGEAAKARI